MGLAVFSLVLLSSTGTAGTASGLIIINPGRRVDWQKACLGPSQGRHCVCVCVCARERAAVLTRVLGSPHLGRCLQGADRLPTLGAGMGRHLQPAGLHLLPSPHPGPWVSGGRSSGAASRRAVGRGCPRRHGSLGSRVGLGKGADGQPGRLGPSGDGDGGSRPRCGGGGLRPGPSAPRTGEWGPGGAPTCSRFPIRSHRHCRCPMPSAGDQPLCF